MLPLLILPNIGEEHSSKGAVGILSKNFHLTEEEKSRLRSINRIYLLCQVYTFQFTGDCPGFYTSNSLDSIMPVLQEYSKKIYDYTMAVNRTTREKYGAISILEMHG